MTIMNIKKGDTVMVIAGADKGKSGKVLKSFPALSRVVVEGVNKHKKHQRPTRSDQKGQVIEKTLPIHASNVMVVDPADGKPTRVGHKLEGEVRIRFAKRSGSTLP